MTGFEPILNGNYRVTHNNIIVAEDIPYSVAASIADDYSYYGKVVNCPFDRSKACKSNFKGCEVCMERYV